MFYSNGASRRLSEDLRSLVYQGLSESKQRAAGTADNRGASESEICESNKNIRKGYTTLRCKMNLAGPHTVQCWTDFKELRLPPDCWRNCKVKPMLYFKSIYIMGKDLGPIIECTHAMIEESKIECPF